MPINGKMPNSINMETTAIKRFSLLIMTLIFLTSCVEEKDFKIIKDEVRKKSEYVMFYMVYDYDVYLESANVYVSENSDMSDCNKYAAGVERNCVLRAIEPLTLGNTYYYYYEFNDGVKIFNSDIKSFTMPEKPIVTTNDVVNFLSTKVTVMCSVISDGNSPLSSKGVCWSGISSQPTIEDNKKYVGDNATVGDDYYCLIDNLKMGKYYVRAFAGNEFGVSYGEVIEIDLEQECDFETKTLYANGVPFKMIAIDGAVFTMGAQNVNAYESNYDIEAIDDESPIHQVDLNKFYLAETEVTQELWEAVMGNNPSIFKGSQRPVDNITRTDCLNFIEKLKSMTGFWFYIPSESQWEFAAKGGNMSVSYKYSGSNDIEDVAWYSENSESCTHDVKQKKPNELGLYDMTGNVQEICADGYGTYPTSSLIDPINNVNNNYTMVIRGGAANLNARYCRNTARDYAPIDEKNMYVGFRLAMERWQ